MQEVTEARRLLWAWLEGRGTGLMEADPGTWLDEVIIIIIIIFIIIITTAGVAGLAREEEVRQPQDRGRGAAASSLAPASPAQPQEGLQPGQRENISQQQKIFVVWWCRCGGAGRRSCWSPWTG